MADMARRRLSGVSSQESRKRKYVDREDETESENTSSSDFPCRFCSSVFVTQISLDRHVLTFHDGEVDVKEEFADENGEYGDTEMYPNYDEAEMQSENEVGYLNDDDYYYVPEEGDSAENINGTEIDLKVPVTNGGSINATAGSNSISMNSFQLTSQKGLKMKLSSGDIASVLVQAEEIAANSTSEFVNCPLCQKTFGRKELPIHISCEHGGAKFTCPYCGRNISRRDHLKRHIKNVHPDKCTDTEIGPFPRNLNLCRANNSQKKPLSPLEIANANQDQQHNEVMQKLLPISIVTPRITVDDEVEDDEEDDFEGEEDLSQSESLQMQTLDSDDTEDSTQITVEPDLPFHDFNDIDYNDDEEDYNTQNFMMDLLNSTNNGQGNNIVGGYRCSVCGATFASKSSLDRHEAIHGELRPHKCAVCGKGFLRKEHLSKHLSSVHSGMKFTCEFCGKDISRKDHLIRHIRNVHPNQFYSMPQEMGHLEQQVSFSQHQQLPVSFKTAQSLQPKPKKPFFSCDMCEATFVNVDDLHAHQATIHSDVRKYKCNYCCKAFKRKEHLTKHEVLHTGERKFACKVCGNEFQRKDALQEHIRRTHGEVDTNGSILIGGRSNATPTIPCNLCDHLFDDRGSLLSHMTTVHGLIVNSPPGLPKNSLLRNTFQQSKHVTSRPAASKPMPSINTNNLGSLVDLINKGSITLSFHPVPSGSN